MRRTRLVDAVGLLAAAVLAAWIGVGCEKLDDSGGVSITPSSVTLTQSSNSVHFTASVDSNMFFTTPLEWYVSDPSLGAIEYQSGTEATYRRTPVNGVNTVIVKVPSGAEGLATVQQVSDAGTTNEHADAISISPANPELSGSVNTVQFTASGINGSLSLPLSWGVSNSKLGIIASQAGYDAVYLRLDFTPGNVNIVTVTDHRGAGGVTYVTQQ